MGATFQFGYLPGLNERLRQRAEYTCTVLGLNREVLVEARRDAFGSYRARLRKYITLRDTTGDPEPLKLLIHAIQRAPHPTVWSEMMRQRQWLTELKPLFEQAPEALLW